MIVHHGNTAHYRYRAERTCRGAGAEPYTSVGTYLIAAAETLCRNAVVRSAVVVFEMRVVKAARAHHLRSHTDGSCDLHAHYPAYLFGDSSAAHGAGICGSFPRRYRSRKSRAARLSAAAAVGAGKDLKYLVGARVALYFKYL